MLTHAITHLGTVLATASILLATTCIAHAESLHQVEWARQIGTSNDDFGSSIAIDPTGNIYLTGSTYGDLHGITNAGDSDAFLSKFDPNGSRLWTQQLGSLEADYSDGVAIDSFGNAYITGSTYGDFDGNLHAGGGDAFLVKYDPFGNKLWTRVLGSVYSGFEISNYDYSSSVAIDKIGNVYISGATTGNLDGNINGKSHIADLSTDAFLTKYDPSGNKVWTRQVGAGGYDRSASVAVDSMGNVYISGDTTYLYEGYSSAGWYDAFLTKFDSQGNKLWSRLLGTPGFDHSYAVASDRWDNVYIGGRTDGDLDGNINAGIDDLFVTKYDTYGNKLWTRQIGTEAIDSIKSIDLDHMDNIYISGNTSGSLDGHNSAGDRDAILIKLDPAGNILWSHQFGTEHRDYSYSVAIDGPGNIYLGGGTGGMLPGNTVLGGLDAVVIKFSQIPEPTTTIIMMVCGPSLLIRESSHNFKLRV